ncbi:site-specific integrase [Bosea sp. AS-1]|uniref:tyrosine-type recombinase/integrase n=1 Tax=Bosea sp. AS-1 TaxID=2015316 RepID=UPI000B78F9C3|nr:site-specific integrase [Bosea sp. AS-1]
MARVLGKLSAKAVAALSKPGRHSDGGGLYLSISADGRRRWVFFFAKGGKQREMGLGSARDVTLARARDLAAECRGHLAEGRDPIEARKRQRERDKPVPTFGEAADALLAEIEKDWTNEKHRYQWKRALEVEAKSLRDMPVNEIEVEHVLKVLRPIWREKPETASRARNRIERVLDASAALGHRSRDNPARWRGNLDSLLGKRERLTRGHHKAVPIDDTPAFVEQLRSRSAMAALALEFTILTAARTGEVIGATWGEIDRAKKLWRVPGERMKMGKPHEVPLSTRALEILDAAVGDRTVKPESPIFHGPRVSEALSNMSMAMLMRRMQVDATPHGFRSTFRDWAGDRTNFPRDIIEHALAHQVGDGTEQAYRRSSALEKRKKLMDAWARYATSLCAHGGAPLLREASRASRV